MAEAFRSRIMNEQDIMRALVRISHEIIEKNADVSEICILGIERRGVPLGDIISDNVEKFSDIKVLRGTLDITFYRDDMTHKSPDPELHAKKPSFSLENKTVIIVDDVIYTGRTVRAAIDAVLSWGRPSKIQFAALIDRGHRELPIRADYIGKNVPTSKSELVKVRIPPFDSELNVEIYQK